MEEEIAVGTEVWYPSKWEIGVVDSVLRGPDGSVMAYVLRREDGTKVAVDMQLPMDGETVQ